jgi:hypothetical protein
MSTLSKTMFSFRYGEQSIRLRYLERRYYQAKQKRLLRAALLVLAKVITVYLLWKFFVIPNIPINGIIAFICLLPLIILLSFSELSGIYSEYGED